VAPDQAEGAASAATTEVKVQRGDTLGAIAVENGTTVAELMKVNDIQNANYIYAGQTIRLP
jgi:LysM repeat protein